MPQQGEKLNGSSTAEMLRRQRHSLQPKISEIPANSFRHTQSHRYDSEGHNKRTKRAVVLPPRQSAINETSEIEEEEDKKAEKKGENVEKRTESHVFTIESEKRSSKSSKKSDKSSYAYDNAAYDSNLDKRSISSRAGSSRQPSVQSLEVVREQYCCCAKRTKCEKKLLLTVTVLSMVVVVLIIVLAIVASNRNIKDDLTTFAGQF
ncbi:unnamed protein product [Phyllotreta striolata]|uniref:Uncharacterized protein n=1 Tax=Phyllotreta striolata TaxID=444603 RepID=A0A9N9THD7_PHYSR|nr:unnamed protein product [Phyllotreta striolata]